MSVDPEPSPSSSSSRDWFFPSHSFVHSSHQYTPKYQNHPRRFSTNTRLSQPRHNDSKPPRTPSFRSVSSSNSSFRDSNYAGIRKRALYSTRREEQPPKPEEIGAEPDRNARISGGKTGEKNVGFSDQRFKVRWRMAICLAVGLGSVCKILESFGLSCSFV